MSDQKTIDYLMNLPKNILVDRYLRIDNELKFFRERRNAFTVLDQMFVGKSVADTVAEVVELRKLKRLLDEVNREQMIKDKYEELLLLLKFLEEPNK